MATYVNNATATFVVGLTPMTTQSNDVTSTSSDGTITLTKTQTLDTIFPESIQEYTITGVSTVGLDATLFTLVDNIPVGLAYVADSFKVDGVTQTPILVGNVLTYIFDAWADGATHTFTFQSSRI